MDTLSNDHHFWAIQIHLKESVANYCVHIGQDSVLEVGRGHDRMLREMEQERYDFANLLEIQLVLKKIVHSVN